MADVRLYILAGTFLAVVVAFIWFVVAVVRARRISRHLSGYHNVPSDATRDDASFDADLGDLEVEVHADAPSAALLTPLRTGEWTPSAEGPLTEALEEVALDKRIVTYQPAPNIPEPAFNVQEYQPWEVGQPAPVPDPGAPVAPAPVASPVIVESASALATDVPEVVPAPSQPAVKRSLDELVPKVGVEVPTARQILEETDVELDAEIASLLPHGLEDEELADATLDDAEQVTAQPEPASVAESEPAPVAESEPVPVYIAEPAAGAEPQVEPVPVYVTEPAAEAEPQVEPVPVYVPEPQPVAASAAEPEEEPITLGEAFGELGMGRPTASVPKSGTSVPPVVVHAVDESAALQPETLSAAAPSAPAVVRPAAKVTSAEPPAPVVEPAPAVRPRRARPVVTVGGTAYLPEEQPDIETAPQRPNAADIPELVMSSPVEMWFGESRVGVKAGSATYDRFRKYADVLLEDLKASKSAIR